MRRRMLPDGGKSALFTASTTSAMGVLGRWETPSAMDVLGFLAVLCGVTRAPRAFSVSPMVHESEDTFAVGTAMLPGVWEVLTVR